MTALHITNGDSAAKRIADSGIGGDVLPWRDPMHHGPFNPGAGLDELRPIRAGYLAGHGMNATDIEREFLARDQRVREIGAADEVVLWFEHDLLDQLQILQVLNHFATEPFQGKALNLICINAFPGVEPFRGLGQLNAEQIAGLFDQKVPVTPEMMAIAKTGWAAFTADDPREIVDFIASDTSTLPFLRSALWRHLEEYPSPQTGLTRTEEQLLRLVQDGVSTPHALFVQNMDFETALFIGDWHTFSVLERLIAAGLVIADIPHFNPSEAAPFRNQKLILTNDGRSVLAGRKNVASLIARDQWLGGVHISPGDAHWTFDREAKELVWRDWNSALR